MKYFFNCSESWFRIKIFFKEIGGTKTFVKGGNPRIFIRIIPDSDPNTSLDCRTDTVYFCVIFGLSFQLGLGDRQFYFDIQFSYGNIYSQVRKPLEVILEVFCHLLDPTLKKIWKITPLDPPRAEELGHPWWAINIKVPLKRVLFYQPIINILIVCQMYSD